MCKILVIPGIKKGKIALAKQLMTEMAVEFGKTETDGIGYAAITADGQIYGEKWLKPEDAFVLDEQPPQPEVTLGESFITDNFQTIFKPDVTPDQDVIYERFGCPITTKAFNNTVACMLHARKKTYGAVNIDNTHPFVVTGDKYVNDIALIHNGSITNHTTLTKKISTCDSETILHEYLKFGMTEYPEAMPKLADALRGQYAVGILGGMTLEDGTIFPYVDIFKSNKNLYIGYVKELETVVFCTWKTDLTLVLEKLGWTLEYGGEIQDEYLLRMNAVTGERCHDLVKFTKSYQTDYYPNNTYPYGQSYNTRQDNVYDLKKEFQEQNKDLFMEPYYNVADLTHEDEVLIKELEKSTNPSQVRALALVKKAVGYK